MPANSDEQSLTERQQEIVRRFAVRMPIKEIASDLGIAPSTVNDHLGAARRKLGLRSNKELARYVLDGLPPFDAVQGTPSFTGAIKDRVAGLPTFDERTAQDDPKPLMLNDSLSLNLAGTWFEQPEPRVVPEELDGPDAAWPRVKEIGKILTLILAAIVLSLTALQSVNSLVTTVPTASSD